MKILSAPYYALFSREFYQLVLMSPLKKGLFYLLYISGISAFLFSAYFSIRIVPQIDAFAEWVSQEVPPMMWTPEGLVMDAVSPYPMIHPNYGILAVIDMSRSEILTEEMGEVVVFLTSTHLYMRDGQGGVRVHDLTRSARDVKTEHLAVTVDGESILKIYKKFKFLLYLLPLLVSFPVILAMKILEVLLLSLPGYWINTTRINPLTYSSVLCVTCFTITAAALIELRWVLPGLSEIPFGFPGVMIVTLGYLYFALKKTEDSSPASPA